MKTYNTQEVISEKKALIKNFCNGDNAIASYNKRVLKRDIATLEAYGKETYQLKDFEENLFLYDKPQFKTI